MSGAQIAPRFDMLGIRKAQAIEVAKNCAAILRARVPEADRAAIDQKLAIRIIEIEKAEDGESAWYTATAPWT